MNHKRPFLLSLLNFSGNFLLDYISEVNDELCVKECILSFVVQMEKLIRAWRRRNYISLKPFSLNNFMQALATSRS